MNEGSKSVSMNKPELSHAVDVEGKEIKASFSVAQFLLHCRCFINNRFLQTKHETWMNLSVVAG